MFGFVNATIQFNEVSVRRGKKQILKNVSFDLKGGQIIGLLGPSGAGKTTIMRSILDVQAGVSGSIVVLDSQKHHKSLLTRVSYSTQSSSVFDDLSILENIKFACRMLGVPLTRANEVISQVGLGALAKSTVAKLSGGERSRVSLAMALVGNPDVLILDEPTVGLDPVLRKDLWNLFRQLADSGKTLIISSHVMSEAELCDQIVFVRDGQVIAVDTPSNLLKQTKTKTAEEAFLKLAEGERK